MKSTVIALVSAVAVLASIQISSAEETSTPTLSAVPAVAETTPAPAVQPKGQAMLEGVISEIRQGKSDFAQMSPTLRVNLTQRVGLIPSLTTRLNSFGEMKTVTFAGLQNGMEIYDVRFAETSMMWSVVVNDEGKISGVRWRFH